MESDRLAKADPSKVIQQLKDARLNKKGAAAQATASAKAAEVAASAKATLAADIISYDLPSFHGDSTKSIQVGPIRHRACEPLYRAFDAQGKGRTVQEGMAASVAGMEGLWRGIIWDGVVVTGELARIPC